MSCFKLLLVLLTYSPKIFSNDYSWTVDEDQDRIAIIDGKIQQELSSTVEIKPSVLYDDPTQINLYVKNIKNESIPLSGPYLEYAVEMGDTLESISEKIYGNRNRWHELLEINEKFLIKNRLEKGAIIKYAP